ncbi:MAG: hypothetical protein Q4G05_02105 [Clostridia bacterium]|nr:hypothetical protein [Clostridia bacterium]
MVKKKVLEFYDINNAVVFDIEKGNINDVWKVELGDESYILKKFKKIEYERLKYIISIENELNEDSNFIKKNKENEYITIYNNEFYVIYKYIFGQKFCREDLMFDMAIDIGKYIGKVHNKLEVFGTKCDKEFSAKLNIRPPNIIEIKTLIEESKDNKYTEFLKNKLEILEKINYNSIVEILEKYSKQIVHGDVYLENLILDLQKNWQLIDYEQTGLFYKEYEIIRALFMICYCEKHSDEDNLNNIKGFIKGYRSINSFMNFENMLNIFIFSIANSLYCFRNWESLSIGEKEFATYRNSMLIWMEKNKFKLIDIGEKWK